MKQKNKFLLRSQIKKLIYLGQLLRLKAYHFNMINTILVINIAALFEA
jgi:hypothetical protein